MGQNLMAFGFPRSVWGVYGAVWSSFAMLDELPHFRVLTCSPLSRGEGPSPKTTWRHLHMVGELLWIGSVNIWGL